MVLPFEKLVPQPIVVVLFELFEGLKRRDAHRSIVLPARTTKELATTASPAAVLALVAASIPRHQATALRT
jgi:hypothetical protein